MLMPYFNFLISIHGNKASWRHTISAPTLTHATDELLKVAELRSWRPMSPIEVAGSKERENPLERGSTD
jgi:hypothetical protein